jgi:hypothetical protein
VGGLSFRDVCMQSVAPSMPYIGRGVVEAPADVDLSDPWLLRDAGIGTVVSVKTADISTPVTGGEPANISLQGVVVATRHLMATGEGNRRSG